MLYILLWILSGILTVLFVNYLLPETAFGRATVRNENRGLFAIFGTAGGPLTVLIAVFIFAMWWTSSEANRNALKEFIKKEKSS